MNCSGRVGLTPSFYSVRTAYTVRNRVVANFRSSSGSLVSSLGETLGERKWTCSIQYIWLLTIKTKSLTYLLNGKYLPVFSSFCVELISSQTLKKFLHRDLYNMSMAACKVVRDARPFAFLTILVPSATRLKTKETEALGTRMMPYLESSFLTAHAGLTKQATAGQRKRRRWVRGWSIETGAPPAQHEEYSSSTISTLI